MSLVALTRRRRPAIGATRTWVSGVGDDVNPCSRTAPCKTFAGSISKTAAGGEISVLDPGGFGAVTITKSITIDGGKGAGLGSILAVSTNGIVINAATTDVVTLRNLSINGAGSGIVGIRILAAGTVFIEDCQIFGFRAGTGSRGISDERTTGGRLFVSNTVVRNNTAGGIVIVPASGSTRINASLENALVDGNGGGVSARTGSLATISNSVITGNDAFGLNAEEAAGNTEVNVDGCIISHNDTGVLVRTGTPTVRLSNATIVRNTVGIQLTSGTVASFVNNRIAANGSGNVPSPGATIPLR